MALTVQAMRRLEVWSNLACAGGSRVVVVADALQVTATVSLDGQRDQLAVRLGLASLAAGEMIAGRVLRVDESDASFDEWRIASVVRDSGAGTCDVVAVPVELDLGARALCTQVDGLKVTRHVIDAVALTPAQLLANFILPPLAAEGLTWVGLGTITPTAPLDISISWESPLAVLRRLAAQTGTEFQLRRNGTTGYLIDLVAQVGASAPVADVRAGRNARGVKLTLDAGPEATRVYPRGSSLGDGLYATMGRAVWQVSAITATTLVHLVDPAGGTEGPVLVSGQLNGYFLRKPNGTLTAINNSQPNGGDNYVDVASVAGLAVGDLVEIRRAADGTELTYLEHPANKSAYGLRVAVLDLPDTPGHRNYVPNAAARAWPSGALPTGWTAVGSPATAKDLTTTQVGGQSIKVTASAGAQGVCAPPVAIDPDANRPYASGYAKVFVASGQVRVELLLLVGAQWKTYPFGQQLATSSGPGAWLDLGVSGIECKALGATQAKLQVVAHLNAATFYVDGAQITLGPGGAQQPFVEGSGGTKLWQAANRKLLQDSAPAAAFDVDVVDLARVDLASYAADLSFVLGGTVRVVDAAALQLAGQCFDAFGNPIPCPGALPSVVRAVGLQRDYLVPGNGKVTLATLPKVLTSGLANPNPRNPRTDTDPPLLPPGINDTERSALNNATGALDGPSTLDPGVTRNDGAGNLPLIAGYQTGTGRHGDHITFSPPYQAAPMVLLEGGIQNEPRAKWNATGDGTGSTAPNASAPQYDDLAPLNVTAAGFDIRARLRQKSAGTARTNSFPAGTLTAVGDALAVTVANAPAANDQYTVRYSVALSAFGPDFAAVDASCIVAVESNDGTGTGWVQRSTQTYSVSGTTSASQSWPAEQQIVTVSGLDATDQIRVRLLALSWHPASTGSATVSIDPASVSYVTAAGDIFASKTPDADDAVRYHAMGKA